MGQITTKYNVKSNVVFLHTSKKIIKGVVKKIETTQNADSSVIDVKYTVGYKDGLSANVVETTISLNQNEIFDGVEELVKDLTDKFEASVTPPAVTVGPLVQKPQVEPEDDEMINYSEMCGM